MAFRPNRYTAVRSREGGNPVLRHSLFFWVYRGWQGQGFFARGGLRDNTGKSRRASGFTHATRRCWIPAFAGKTKVKAGMTNVCVGCVGVGCSGGGESVDQWISGWRWLMNSWRAMSG